MEADIENSRFELKYRIPYQNYLKVKNAIEIYMKKDKFTRAAKGKGYLVRSLYYDTDDYASYLQKMDGDNQRVKLRIRSYSSIPGDSNPIRTELKTRRGDLVIKKSTFVSNQEYKNFRKFGYWQDLENSVLIEFQRYMLSEIHKPKVLIQYYREGYESRSNNDLRITFDHEVKSGHTNLLFPKHLFFREHNSGFVILEIKFKNNPPIWVQSLVQNQGLKIIANSKFTQAIQVSRHDLNHPGGVIVIR